MNRTALTLAAAVALAAVAGPARADHDDGWRDHDRRDRAWPAPAPAYVPPAPAPARPWRVARFEGGRFRELREAQARLDHARDRFYATWRGDDWQRDRFEAWYGARCAELDRRWADLERWRDRGRW